MPRIQEGPTPAIKAKAGQSYSEAAVLDLRQLKTFLIVASTTSFTGTSRELGCSQSNVSHRIRELEYHLGVTLLNRSRLKRNVTVTRVGLLTVEYAQRLLALAEEAESAIKKTRNGAKRRATAS